ncbi:hypothetical protein ARALYDRAFT_908862 [Arabidopsis lyrata subsp. lyrata]|uniref:Uncharacterized protein n=1 Tax=Arabidopsis lyrata subsp. lyrata TaxID=81972 RepID=D7M211_ARALL|nr:hypothetical protein ARALYDRAFT_908862 [Arabidopsis lyrata subsp. lyrata]
MQTYAEITSDAYLDYIKLYVPEIGQWKDTIVPVNNNCLMTPTVFVARAHSRNLQFLHLEFNQGAYLEYDYWLINKIRIDGLFTRSLHNYQKLRSPLPK